MHAMRNAGQAPINPQDYPLKLNLDRHASFFYSWNSRGSRTSIRIMACLTQPMQHRPWAGVWCRRQVNPVGAVWDHRNRKLPRPVRHHLVRLCVGAGAKKPEIQTVGLPPLSVHLRAILEIFASCKHAPACASHQADSCWKAQAEPHGQFNMAFAFVNVLLAFWPEQDRCGSHHQEFATK